MRHLELPVTRQEEFIETDVKSECSIDIKDEDLEGLDDIKTEFMDLPLDVSLVTDVDIQTSLKTELTSGEESAEDIGVINSPKSHSSIGSNSLEAPLNIKLKIRNRRKSSQPQRAFQSDAKHDESTKTEPEDYEELEEGEDGDKDIETDIFKGIKDENGEEFDEEMQRNVKEEWKSHWGVKCNMCEKMFSQKSVFDKHYRTSYNSRPMYTCSYCDKTMDKYSTFRSHCYRHITEGRFKCYKCEKGFSLESTLHDHILAKHTEIKPFICEECGKGFVTKPGLKIHLKKHKTDEKEDYPCAQCGKILHTRGGLTAHMNVHRLGRRFMCDVCGKTFTQKVNMQQHVKHHSGERPHACTDCGKRFAEKSHLARHRSFHSEHRPHRCDICGKMYKTERCLKVHALVHAASRPYVCTYCEKGFLSSTKLKQHLNIHTGQRPFKCKYCERTFTNYPNWLKHTRRRHKVDHRTGLHLQLPTKVEQPDAPPSTPLSTTPSSLSVVPAHQTPPSQQHVLAQMPTLIPLTGPTVYSSGTSVAYSPYLLEYTSSRLTEENTASSITADELAAAVVDQVRCNTAPATIDFITGVGNEEAIGLVVPCYDDQFSAYIQAAPSQPYVEVPTTAPPDGAQYTDHFQHAQLLLQQQQHHHLQQHVLHM